VKLSIIIPVLNSHEIVKRQLQFFTDMPFSWDSEVILIDDGSKPPLGGGDPRIVRIIRTHDDRPWTQPIARNLGAKIAEGENLLFTDIDHIIPKETIEFAEQCPYDYARFRREIAVLDEKGHFTQDRDVLEQYGYPKENGLRVGCHTLSMVIKASVFKQTGGFRENVGSYPTHDDGEMKKKLIRLGALKCPDKDPDERPMIYVFPNGRFSGGKDCNPLGLFHDLKRQ
jgi:glycosyltransferase involved in cell wall biosynthesis